MNKSRKTREGGRRDGDAALPFVGISAAVRKLIADPRQDEAVLAQILVALVVSNAND
jgi:hypothetical protein